VSVRGRYKEKNNLHDLWTRCNYLQGSPYVTSYHNYLNRVNYMF